MLCGSGFQPFQVLRIWIDNPEAGFESATLLIISTSILKVYRIKVRMKTITIHILELEFYIKIVD